MRRPYGPMHENETFRRGNACVALFGIGGGKSDRLPS